MLSGAGGGGFPFVKTVAIETFRKLMSAGPKSVWCPNASHEAVLLGARATWELAHCSVTETFFKKKKTNSYFQLSNTHKKIPAAITSIKQVVVA